MGYTTIEWTEKTWNPVTGCTKVSQGCKYCYAERLYERFNGKDSFKTIICHEDRLTIPETWRKPRLVFVNSMSDLFHEHVPLEFIQKVFKVMNDCPQHTFQILTKRSERLLQCSSQLNWTPNIWMGVSIENDQVIHRMDDLKNTGAKVKFLSCEPLLGPLSGLNLYGIGWVIVGGESGPNARPMHKEWVTEIKDICGLSNVPFFFKQWGGKNKKEAGRELDGRTYDEMPIRSNKKKLL